MMYQEFKRKLLDEMEMRRDILVLKASETSLEPIFEVSSSDDKLYRRILEEFDRIAVRHVDNLLYDLCEKHGVDVERADSTGRYDLKISVKGQLCCIELKTSPMVFNADSLHRFIDRVKNCQQSVYLIYLLKDNQQSRNAIAQRNIRIQRYGDISNLKTMLLEDFILELFGVNELNLFKKAMLTYKEEMHQAVGYQITEIFNFHNLALLKKELEEEFINFEYERIKRERFSELHSVDTSLKDLNSTNFKIIKNQFINQKRYRLLLGNGDFAKSFLTSEWLFKKYFSLAEMDNTYIVTGYLKSIEQLLWDIIYIKGQGRQMQGVRIEEDNTEGIDTTLGALQYFITNYANDDFFETIFGSSTHFIMRYLRTQLSDWRSKYRNGYFHKQNLVDRERIDVIRDETIYLYLLIVGTISLD
ncbi:MAG: hypothetical protein K2H85_12160, partial [Allobaculum sp.]|nr:hypothetical protein [Allobaculum sp.]